MVCIREKIKCLNEDNQNVNIRSYFDSWTSIHIFFPHFLNSLVQFQCLLIPPVPITHSTPLFHNSDQLGRIWASSETPEASHYILLRQHHRAMYHSQKIASAALFSIHGIIGCPIHEWLTGRESNAIPHNQTPWLILFYLVSQPILSTIVKMLSMLIQTCLWNLLPFQTCIRII